MSASRKEIVAEARSWIGTPWHHQAALKGVGCDCAGLLSGVAAKLSLIPTDYATRPEWQDLVRYRRVPDGQSLKSLCDRVMQPVAREAMLPGDAVLFRVKDRPQHLGIIGDHPHGGFSLIHAASTNDGRGRVVETRLAFHTRLTFVAAYRFPGVSA